MTINYLINESLKIVRQDVNHNLNPVYRTKIYSFWGPESISLHEIEQLDIPIWHKVRGWLAILSAKRVLPIWYKSMQNNEPTLWINLGEDILKGIVKIENLDENIWDRFYHSFVGLNDEILLDVLYAGVASREALNMVIGLKPFSTYILTNNITDENISAGNGDGASAAIKAYSTIYNYEDKSKIKTHFDPQKKLEFWEWWLTEAIPKAWELAQSSYQDKEKNHE